MMNTNQIMWTVVCGWLAVAGWGGAAWAQAPDAAAPADSGVQDSFVVEPPEELEAEGVGEEDLALPASVSTTIDPGSLRDPFWPVGYSPAVAVAPTAVVAQAVQPVAPVAAPPPEETEEMILAKVRSQIRVGGVLGVGDRRVALINNQPLGEGESFTIKYKDRSFHFVVRTITADNASVEMLDQAP